MRTRRAMSDCPSMTCARSSPPPMRSPRELELWTEVAATTGARPSQIARLDVVDLQDDRADPRMMMPSSKKGRAASASSAARCRSRRVWPPSCGRPPEPAGRRALLTKPDGARWQRADHVKPFALAAAQAGLAGVTAYALRHCSSFAHCWPACRSGSSRSATTPLWRCWKRPIALSSSITPMRQPARAARPVGAAMNRGRPVRLLLDRPYYIPHATALKAAISNPRRWQSRSSSCPLQDSKTLAISELRVWRMTDPHMTFIEAVAWIATRDSRFSDKCRDMTHRRLALSLAIRKNGGEVQYRSSTPQRRPCWQGAGPGNHRNGAARRYLGANRKTAHSHQGY